MHSQHPLRQALRSSAGSLPVHSFAATNRCSTAGADVDSNLSLQVDVKGKLACVSIIAGANEIIYQIDKISVIGLAALFADQEGLWASHDHLYVGLAGLSKRGNLLTKGKIFRFSMYDVDEPEDNTVRVQCYIDLELNGVRYIHQQLVKLAKEAV